MSKDNFKNRPARPRFELSRFDVELLNVEPENWKIFREELNTIYDGCDYHTVTDLNSCYNIGLDWCNCREGQTYDKNYCREGQYL